MQKIISLFQRNYDGDRLVRDEVVPSAEWVMNGEGHATRKWDGLAVMYKGSTWFKRYDAKAFTMDGGKKRVYNRTPPDGFIPIGEPDAVTGHWPGWVPCDANNTADKLLFETISTYKETFFEEGTYELIGPKIGTRGGANPEKLTSHCLKKHGSDVLMDAPRTYSELKDWLINNDIEGIVWHHPDGRMVKIKKKDFGLHR